MCCEISILDFKSKQQGNLIILQVFVHSQVSESLFIVGDESDYAMLSVASRPEFCGRIDINMFLKLLNPAYECGIVIPGHVPLECKPFKYKELDTHHRNAFISTEMFSFDHISSLSVKTVIPNLLARVHFVSEVRNASHKVQYKIIGVTDYKNQKHAIMLFGKYVESAEIGKVYQFTALQVTNFKSATDTWNRLSTSSASFITEASKDIAKEFLKVGENDGMIEGVVLGHEKPNLYLSCPCCGMRCKDEHLFCREVGCGAVLNEKVYDFNVILHVKMYSKEYEIKRVFCLRHQLGIVIKKCSQNALTEQLENLNFEKVKVHYKKSYFYQDQSLKATEIFFTGRS